MTSQNDFAYCYPAYSFVYIVTRARILWRFPCWSVTSFLVLFSSPQRKQFIPLIPLQEKQRLDIENSIIALFIKLYWIYSGVRPGSDFGKCRREGKSLNGITIWSKQISQNLNLNLRNPSNRPKFPKHRTGDQSCSLLSIQVFAKKAKIPISPSGQKWGFSRSPTPLQNTCAKHGTPLSNPEVNYIPRLLCLY